MSGKYDDIIDLPHYEPKHHARMSMSGRAAQFSPFAALTGFGAVIDETARLTDDKIELGESAVEALERRLNGLAAHIGEHPEVTVTYFEPDEHKSGGAYLTHTGALHRIDEQTHELVFADGKRVKLGELLEIEYSG